MELHIGDIPCVPKGKEAVVRIEMPGWISSTGGGGGGGVEKLTLTDIEDYIYTELMQYFKLDGEDIDANMSLGELLECKLHFRRLSKAFVKGLSTRMA